MTIIWYVSHGRHQITQNGPASYLIDVIDSLSDIVRALRKIRIISQTTRVIMPQMITKKRRVNRYILSDGKVGNMIALKNTRDKLCIFEVKSSYNIKSG